MDQLERFTSLFSMKRSRIEQLETVTVRQNALKAITELSHHVFLVFAITRIGNGGSAALSRTLQRQQVLMFLRLISELVCNQIIRTLLLESVEVLFSEFSLEMRCENDNEIVQFLHLIHVTVNTFCVICHLYAICDYYKPH